MRKRLVNIILVLPVLLALSSCLGVNADIVFNTDKSGTIALEYRISSLMESIGRQDGNEGYPVVPVGKTDIERTVARLPGMKLLSYNTRDDKNDKIVDVKLQFTDPQVLCNFLDASGEMASFAGGNNSQKMAVVLSGGPQTGNQDFDDLLRSVCAGYSINVSASFPSNGSLTLLDKDGKAFAEKVQLVPSGKKVSFSLPLETVLFAQNGIKAEFTW
ncbi:MAG: hypothetical protein FWF22_01245 [Treponema sp.]|nr:hypothetical protein [Treponema sp.]